MGNTNISLPDGVRSATTDAVDEKMSAQIAAGPPVNVDVPYAQQQGEQLTCTMGNWEGEPRDYAYQWMADDLLVEGGAASVYELSPEEVGMTFECEVTASHSGGATTVTSNPVTIASV